MLGFQLNLALALVGSPQNLTISIYWHIWDLFLDNADIFLVCHAPHVLNRTDWLQSIYYQLNEGTADTHHIYELFLVVGC